MENTSDDKVNVFLAYMLEKQAAEETEKVARIVRDVFHPLGKDEEYFHCTLLFIGRVDKALLPDIEEKASAIARTMRPISFTIDYIGYFYNAKKDRVKVLYAVPSVIPEELRHLCARLYEEIGKPLQGKTTPPIQEAKIHFTITKRLKQVLSRKDFKHLSADIPSFKIPVAMDQFGLYFCKDPQHRYYREIKSWMMGEGDNA
jgi:2'-5' RNA ligase